MMKKTVLLALLLQTLFTAQGWAADADRDTLSFVFDAHYREKDIINPGGHEYGTGDITLVANRNDATVTLTWKDKVKNSFALEPEVVVYNHSGLMFEFIEKGYGKTAKALNRTIKNYFYLVLNTYGDNKADANEKRFNGYGAFGIGGTKGSLGWSDVYYVTTKPVKAGAEFLVEILAEANDKELLSFAESIISGTHPYFRVKEIKGTKPVTVRMGK